MSSAYIYNLTPISYALPLLHAAAHPSSSVQGVFLAETSATSSSSTTTGSGKRPLELVDAIPLLHAETTLTPVLEAALEHVEVYAGKKGLVIVGMYEVGEGSTLSRAGKAFLGGLKKNWEHAFALTVSPSLGLSIRKWLTCEGGHKATYFRWESIRCQLIFSLLLDPVSDVDR